VVKLALATTYWTFPEVAMLRFCKVVLFLGLLWGLVGCANAIESTPYSINGTPLPNAIYADDFSNPKSGWETWTDANGSFVAYQNNGLRILVKDQQFDYWSRPGRRFVDASIEVDAIKLAGPNDNDFGLICRYQDRNNFYAFLISSDGYAGIIKVADGKYNVLNGTELAYSQSIRQGEALNHLQANCVGQSLALAVNGEVVAQVQDAAFAAGEVGVVAGTNDNPGVDIFFDNFVVNKP
jgi:hypothetical protein